MRANVLFHRFATLAIMATLVLANGIAQAPSPNAPSGPPRTPEELDELMAPIALYPDALIALILPAAAAPADIGLAIDYIDGNRDPAQIDAQAWDASVKGLAHYPDVLKWMNENAAWTQQVGAAFLTQPSDVMKSIQQLRSRALAAGTLASTPQQEVITDSDGIRIIPAQPNVIYVPNYDPTLVYDGGSGNAGPWLTFGTGYAEGPWLGYDLDWDNYGIWVGGWHPGWDYRHPQWRGGARGAEFGHRWEPRPGQPFGSSYAGRSREPIVHPQPFAAAGQRRPPERARSPGFGMRPGEARQAPRPSARPDLRGYPSPAPRAPAPTTVYGGYNRGSDARQASQRGQASRQESRPAPQRASPSQPSGRGGGERK
jgi:hypothetical protein